MLSNRSVWLLTLVVHRVTGFREKICSFPQMAPDVVDIYLDKYHKTLIIDWTLPGELHAVFRAIVGSKPIPSCEDMGQVLDANPAILDWKRENAAATFGNSQGVGKCHDFPFQLRQGKDSITLDCFYLNKGDSRISWTGSSSVCVEGLRPWKLDGQCDIMKKFVEKVLNAASEVKAKEPSGDKELHSRLQSMRKVIADSDDDENSESSDWDDE
jgi:hypothetical protein